MSDYYESAEGIEISHARAIVELRRHGLGDDQNIAEFETEMGKREIYDAQAVLGWLGY